MTARALLLLVGVLSIGTAADRDFLTTDEADQIRLAQEPDVRLKLYVDFAKQRVDLVQNLLSEEKAGRSTMVHEVLEDYTKIVEAIDTVADDALLRGLKPEEGIKAVVEAEKAFIATLEQVQDSGARDLERFRFVLVTAIETTQDSLEMNLEDLHERTNAVAEREKQERKDLEELMTPETVKERQDQATEKKKEETEQKRKAPSLYKKGEKKPEPRP